MRRTLLLTLFFIFTFFSCTHKEVKKETGKTKEKMLDVYYRLINGIKKRDLNIIASCYEQESSYQYHEELNHRFKCFNNEIKINGIDNVLNQYKFLFKSKLLDRIEFDIIF